MNFELTPRTEPGKRFVILAEAHAADFATRADAETARDLTIEAVTHHRKGQNGQWDVRASGPFMQLFSPNEVFEYIGKVTLGLDLTPD